MEAIQFADDVPNSVRQMLIASLPEAGIMKAGSFQLEPPWSRVAVVSEIQESKDFSKLYRTKTRDQCYGSNFTQLEPPTSCSFCPSIQYL